MIDAMNEVKQKMAIAQQKAKELFAAVEERGLMAPGKSESQLIEDVVKLANDLFGIDSFWHKKIYPYQVWLDGLYMAQPFFAEYANLSHEDSLFDDIADQFTRIEKHTRDPKTGLLYHAWDESKEQRWANKQTGLSPHIWARAMGWYAVALVDALGWFPENHPRKKELSDH